MNVRYAGVLNLRDAVVGAFQRAAEAASKVGEP